MTSRLLPSIALATTRSSGTLSASVVLALALATLACQPDNPAVGGPRTEVRDSAGIRVIENPRPPEGSRLDWRIGPEHTVSIGELTGEEPYLLSFVRDATRLRDGRIVVANGGSNELRFFDAAGIHLATRAGGGEGPGEFERLLRVERWPGDSIVAWRAARAGFSVFDSDGNYGRSFTLADAGSTPGFLWTVRCPTNDGGMLVYSNRESGGIGDIRIMEAMDVQIRDGEGEVLDVLGTHPGPEQSGMLLATVYARGFVAELWGDLVIISTNFRYELKAFTRDGTLARIVRRGHELRAPTEAEVVAYIDAVSRPGTSPRENRSRFQSVPIAEHFPAYGAVMSDRAGYLWVREYDFPLEERPAPLWTVFDPDGRVLGFVETPKDLRIFEIGEDYILGTYRDALGVQSVQLWPLVRSGG